MALRAVTVFAALAVLAGSLPFGARAQSRAGVAHIIVSAPPGPTGIRFFVQQQQHQSPEKYILDAAQPKAMPPGHYYVGTWHPAAGGRSLNVWVVESSFGRLSGDVRLRTRAANNCPSATNIRDSGRVFTPASSTSQLLNASVWFAHVSWQCERESPENPSIKAAQDQFARIVAILREERAMRGIRIAPCVRGRCL